MAKKKNASMPRLPWIQENPGRDEAVLRLVSQLYDTKTQKITTTPLDAKAEKELQRKYQDAQQGRSTADKYMRAIAKQINGDDPGNSVIVAPMKEWTRIVDKFNASAKGVDDLGRGCIYIDSVAEYKAFTKILRGKNKDGVIPSLHMDRVSIKDGSIDDYIAEPKSSGYAGSVNFNVEMDIGKGRTGMFEIQIRPRAYQDISKKSHRLYDMIRIFDTIPKAYLNPSDTEVRDCLITANTALYEELALRNGFDAVLKNRKPLEISLQDSKRICSTLDRIRSQIEALPGRNYAWKAEAADAITYAKSSVTNITMATCYKHQTPKELNAPDHA